VGGGGGWARRPAEPRLVAIGGLSGSGKSTVSRAVGPELGARPGARWLRSDVIRKVQAGVDENEKLPSTAYGPGTSVPVYQEMYERTEAALRAGHSVILDAVFAREEERHRASQLAQSLNVPFNGIWLEAPVEIRKARVAERKNDASDADTGVVDKQMATDLGTIRWTRVDAGAGAIERVRDLLIT
ncbi:MAG: AAA family ATPase, partial [Myxococcota bacterium]